MSATSSTSSLVRWSLDYHTFAPKQNAVTSSQGAQLDPPGYAPPQAALSKKAAAAQLASKSSSQRAAPTPEQLAAILNSKAWEVATAPLKSLPMNLFMLYMSGSGVQIFSMMIVGMLLTNPLRAMAGVRDAFAPLTPPPPPVKDADAPSRRSGTSTGPASAPTSSSALPAHLPQMAVYVVAQLLALALGLYKCWSMGLLPTESSDWLAWKGPREYLELAPISPP